jgi:hypothetical protein
VQCPTRGVRSGASRGSQICPVAGADRSGSRRSASRGVSAARGAFAEYRLDDFSACRTGLAGAAGPVLCPRRLPLACSGVPDRGDDRDEAARDDYAPRRVGKPVERELTGSFSARRGPYRVLYRIDDDAKRVTILRVAHRADACRPWTT